MSTHNNALLFLLHENTVQRSGWMDGIRLLCSDVTMSVMLDVMRVESKSRSLV